MERTIKLADLQAALDEAYNKFKDCNEGSVDPRADGADPAAFGISVTLTDGTTLSAGNVDTPSPIGSIGKLPALNLFLQQNTPEQIHEKMGSCCCKKQGCASKPHIPVSAKGVRLVSALQPQNDSDGKWDLIISTLVGMTGSEPVLSDKLYRSLKQACVDGNAEDTLAAAGYFLYDDAPIAIDLYARLSSLTLTPVQLSAMMATVAADGYNPVSKQNAFDGALSQRLSAYMATKGPHKMAKPWLMCTGLPALSSFGGAVAGAMPGAFGIAAYSPLVNEAGVSKRASKAIAYVMNRLQLSALASARVTFEK